MVLRSTSRAATAAADAAGSGRRVADEPPAPRSTSTPSRPPTSSPTTPPWSRRPAARSTSSRCTPPRRSSRSRPGVDPGAVDLQRARCPARALRGKVGDIFTVTLVNDGTLGHSIDFHASKVAWNDEMRTIEPGESLVYQFEAKHAGILMYHCGTPPALHHIGNGMYGAIIIDPPDLAPVDHEFVLRAVRALPRPQGRARRPRPRCRPRSSTPWCSTATSTSTCTAPSGWRPASGSGCGCSTPGPSENSSFHIVGTIFDTVFKEGAYLLQPDAGRRRIPGARPPARTGRVRRVHLRRGRAVPLRHPQVRQRGQGRPRRLPGRRGLGHRRRRPLTT